MTAVVILALGLAVAVGLYGFLRTVASAAPPGRGERRGGESSLRQLAGLVYGLQAASMLVGVTLFAA